MTLDMNWNETAERREKLCEEGHIRSEILKAFYRLEKGYEGKINHELGLV